jgi:hypothetical protein
MTTHHRILWIVLLAPVGCGAGMTTGNTGGSGGSGGAGGDGGGATASANSQACQLLKSGPFSMVTGKSTYTIADPGPPVLNDKKVYRIALPAATTAGHVSFKAPATGEFVVFTNRSLAVTVFTWDGLMIQMKTVAASVSECPEVKGRQSFDLALDTKPHSLRIGPDPGGSVDLVLTAATP